MGEREKGKWEKVSGKLVFMSESTNTKSVRDLARRAKATGFCGSGGEIYIVVDEESESQVENLEILHPDLEIKEKPKNTENLYFPLFPLFLGGGGSLITGGSG